MITNALLAAGRVIREPVGHSSGYWVGCPGAYYDAAENEWYLTYRVRRPRGVSPDRGGEVRIARSVDLERWEDVVTLHKDVYQSASIERSCVHRGNDGEWRYLTSYVHPSDGRWCTAIMKAPSVSQLDPAKRKILFSGPPLGLEGVKDPWIIEHDGVYHLFLSVATPTPRTSEGSHASLDIFNTGECKSATALAISHDLDRWEWKGVIFAPGATGWDRYCRRINSIVQIEGVRGNTAEVATSAGEMLRPQRSATVETTPPSTGTPAKMQAQTPRFLAFYDGSASHLENYEEKCALAISDDLRIWRSISTGGPAFTSPHASKSVRYFDVKRAGDDWNVFYEFAREDGAHDLRMIQCEPATFVDSLGDSSAGLNGRVG
jgi:hypothetical protein